MAQNLVNQDTVNVKGMPFLTDIKTVRERARQHIKDGAVTGSYGGDTQLACKLLNEALATELVCVLRYKRHFFMAKGLDSGPVKAEFQQHAAEEQGHADRIAERIVQLGGEPNFSPDGLLSRSHSEYAEGQSLTDMIKEDLIAERIAVDTYREVAAWFASFDSTTRRMLEDIQAVEEEHADDLAELLEHFPEDRGAKSA
jgi:bacterioferritin